MRLPGAFFLRCHDFPRYWDRTAAIDNANTEHRKAFLQRAGVGGSRPDVAHRWATDESIQHNKGAKQVLTSSSRRLSPRLSSAP